MSFFATRIFFESVNKRIASLRSLRKPVILCETDLLENHVKGSGPGGQAVNKTNNAVSLVHKPTGIAIRCHKTRSLEQNRKEARKLLTAALDDMINGESSQSNLKRLKEQARKQVRASKANKKYKSKD